jgi:Tol biopolymer transport system component
MTKVATYAVLIAAMAAFGFGVYRVADAMKSNPGHSVRPTSTTAVALPGTMYVAQQGALYEFKGGQFHQITGDDGWTEPAASPDGSQLVAVSVRGNASDLFLLSMSGQVIAQLTHHASGTVEANHWSFLPRFSADGTQVFYSYDNKSPYDSYRVDLTIFARGVSGQGGAAQWTIPNDYTGGDTNPVPLRSGALIYTKFSIDDKSKVHSQVWLSRGPLYAGVPLTAAADNCMQPAVSPDETAIAMICRHDSVQSTQLVEAMLDPARAIITQPAVLVADRLSAGPAFSPDGKTVAFLAPVQTGGPFQLWTVPVTAAASGGAARPITQNVALDSASAPVWMRS